jgi:pimeloyl-ACP methyl ester carboxylesterase
VALIAPDRPGFGNSSPNPRARSVDAAIGDVHDLADHLGLRRFGVIGVSCGGAYALASARLMPDRVSAVGLLAGIGPMDRREARDGQLPALRLLFALARVHPALALPMLALDALLFRADAERAVRALSSMLSAPDRALLASDADVRMHFGRSLADAYRQGPGAAAMEAMRIARHRSDTLDGIAQPVHVYRAGHDRHVPPAIGRFIASRLPRATLHDCPQEGHLSIVVSRFDDCARRVMQAGA